MRNTGPKTRYARRIGEPLRDKDAKIFTKRNYPPGMHGQSRRRKSEYGRQLAEKQKAKWIYGLTERQFRRYAAAAARKKGMTGELLLAALEFRLDNVVYRLGFAQSRAQARQIVGHRFITVNGKRVNIPSYKVSIGDEVAVAESKKKSKYVERLLPQIKVYSPQDWLSVDVKQLTGRILTKPTYDNTGSTIQPQLIVEHYSR